jgi:hypothetical protein
VGLKVLDQAIDYYAEWQAHETCSRCESEAGKTVAGAGIQGTQKGSVWSCGP